MANQAPNFGERPAAYKSYAESLNLPSQSGNAIRSLSSDAWNPSPFDILVLTLDSIQVTRCWYMRGPLTKLTKNKPVAALSGTDVYVAAQIDTVADSVTLVVHADISAAFDITLPSDSQYVKIPLYHLTRTDIASAWTVAADYRLLPNLPLYT